MLIIKDANVPLDMLVKYRSTNRLSVPKHELIEFLVDLIIFQSKKLN